jgi:formamidopyrimidine-DNA glycosylase
VPELPEVETVRAGLERHVLGARIGTVTVNHPRAVRRHVAGADDFRGRLTGARIEAVRRRGKYLWLDLTGVDGDASGPPDTCLLVHLGMSGQVLVAASPAAEAERHLHVRLRLADDRELRFIDQRTFGGMLVDHLVPTTDDVGDTVPSLVAHIARDPLDPHHDDEAFLGRLRRRDTELKRALLDQTLIAGVGNIYADEALWRSWLHGRRRTATLPRPRGRELLGHVREVFGAALRAGGTSFDALYVNVNGQSGYFDRSLAVYGQEGRPCSRCGTPVRREAFMNRSSFFCPHCQPVPRRRRP